jgi:hypothetical protein
MNVGFQLNVYLRSSLRGRLLRNNFCIHNQPTLNDGWRSAPSNATHSVAFKFILQTNTNFRNIIVVIEVFLDISVTLLFQFERKIIDILGASSVSMSR